MFYSERNQGSPQAVRLCRLQNRSLLSVNEDFEGKRNTEIYFLVTLFISFCIMLRCRPAAALRPMSWQSLHGSRASCTQHFRCRVPCTLLVHGM